MFKKLFGLLIVGLMLACGALSGVNATPSDSKVQDTFNFNFTINTTYSLTYDEFTALYVALLEDPNLNNWVYKNTNVFYGTSFGFAENESVIDLFSITPIPYYDLIKANKLYNKSSVVEIPYHNGTDRVNATVNINIHK
jgi:hypothetical protein